MADFAQVKKIVSMETVIAYLQLKLKNTPDAFRGPCPICSSDSPRAFVATKSKQLFYCFACEVGGDCIELYARVKNISTKDAANELEKHFKTEPSGTDLEPLDYLVADHAAVAALGIAEDVAKALGIGYAPRGTMKGRVLLPLRTIHGKLVAYVGLNLAHDEPIALPKQWKF